MDKKFSAICCAFVLPAIMVLILQYFKEVPIWALVVAWACFFHLGGGDKPNLVAKELLTNSIIGTLIGWVSALLILSNPIPILSDYGLWGPLVIGLAIALITAFDSFKPMSITPVVIYGFALNWGFLSVPGMLNLKILTAIEMKNVAIAVPIALFLGAFFGFINAISINILASSNHSIHKKNIEIL
jgi:Protein of unknown function (DUF1097)